MLLQEPQWMSGQQNVYCQLLAMFFTQCVSKLSYSCCSSIHVSVVVLSQQSHNSSTALISCTVERGFPIL